MEVRVIKTCQGFQRLLILDGAPVSAHDVLDEVPQLTQEEIEILNQLTIQLCGEDRKYRANQPRILN